MRTLLKLTWLEMKLFIREPITMVITFALPVIFVFVMGGVFGNTPDPEGTIYRGVGPMDYYVPAYIGLVATSVGVVALPVHLTAYRERGVLRRLRASSISLWHIFGSQVLVSFMVTFIGAVLVTVIGILTYDAHLPVLPWLMLPAFILSTLCFASLGVLLGAVFPTTRAAQGTGLLLFFVMLILAGAGPPREVMTDVMRLTGDAMPLRYVVLLLQEPWLGFGWDTTSMLIVIAITLTAGSISLRFFRWE